MANSMAVLADRGFIQAGTKIELVPSVCRSAPTADRFRAVVVNPRGGAGALEWPVDGKCYSAQALLTKLEQEDGVCGVPGVFRNWRIVGHERSIWDEANTGGMISDDEIPAKEATDVSPKTPAATSTAPQEGVTRLQHIKLVLEIIAVALTVIGGIAALFFRSR